MSELTTLLLEEHRRAAKEAYSPERLMAHEFALAKRLEGRSHWWSRWWSQWPTWQGVRRSTRRETRRGPDVGRMTPCDAC